MRLRFAVLLSVLVVVPAARAATITVTTTSSAFNPGDGQCSLPEAVAAAGGFTVAECTTADTSGIDDIVLPAGTIDTQNLMVQDVRLLGQGAGATFLDAGANDRVLIATGTVELHGLTVAHGLAHPGGIGADGESGGGVLLAAGASVTLADCAIADNAAGHGGQGSGSGGGGYGGSGGGVYVPGGASLTVSRCTISGNRAGAGGPGGSNSSSSGAVSGGPGGAGGNGGGVFAAFDSTVTIDGSTFIANHAGDGGLGGTGTGDPGGTGGSGGFGGVGGGFASTGGPVSIAASTFSANAAGNGGDGGDGKGFALTTSSGTGGAGAGGGSGGGAYLAKGVSDPSDTITNVTMTGNAAGAGGDGGRGQGSSSDTITFGSSVPGQGAVGGDAGDLLVASAHVALAHDTIVAGQVGAPGHDYGGAVTAGAGNGPGILYSHSGTPMTVGRSILSDCAGDALTDLGFDLGTGGCPGSGADPQLGPLQDNGGLVQTMRPLAGSPAIDAVPSNQGCAAADARGVPRPVGIACDIGAVEVAPPSATTGDPSGATLTGTVDGHGLATKVAFEYGDSAAYGASLTALPITAAGPTAESVTLGPLLPGTYHYRVTATNGDGTSVGADKTLTITGPGGPGGGGSAPVISKLSFKPKRLKRGRRATVRFRISEAASVKLSFARRAGKRYRAAGSLTRTVRAGAVKLTFKRRALKAGRYRLTLVATDAGKRRSKPVSTTFTVVAA